MASVHEIPPNIQSIDELRLAINDRLRRLAGGGSLQITGDLDMKGNRILNLGTPGGLNDGATLADVRRSAGRPSLSQAATAALTTGIDVHPAMFDYAAFPGALSYGDDLTATQRAVNLLMGEHLSVTRYGAKPDGVEIEDASMASGSDILESPTAGFGGGVVGMTFVVPGAAGATADPLVATCIARISGTQVQLSVSATAATSTDICVYGTNNTAAINAALADPFVRSTGSLFFPSGVYLVGGDTLNILSNIDIYGAGWSTVIYAADYTNSSFYAQSQSKISIRGLSFKSHAYVRSSLSTTPAIWIRECSRVEVSNIRVDGSTSAGIFIDLCDSAHVHGVEVRNTKADGVHIVGCVEAIVDGVRGYNTGDDTVSVVSYASQAQAVKVSVINVISVNSRTRAVAVGGSKNVLVSHCLAIAPGAHGIIVAYESGGTNPAAELHTPSRITISNCRMEDALGALGPPEGFNSLLIAGDATHLVDDVLVQGCTIIGSNQAKIAFASNVRIIGNEIRDSRYSGLIVEDCEDVDTINCKFKEVEGIGLSYVRVEDGQISGNRFTDCQTLDEFGTGASSGRIHIIESTDVYGFGNRDKRASTYAAIPSYGAILVSGGARVAVGVTEIRPTAVDTNKRVIGMEVASLRDAGDYKDQLLLGTNIPVNVDRYAIVSDRGMFVEEGDIHIDGTGKFLGSGGSASLDLYSGFAQLVAASSARVWINRNDSSSGNTFYVTTGSGETQIFTMTTGGEIYTAGGLHPGGAPSGAGWFAYDGDPNGNVSAPIGSWCTRNWSSLAASGSDGPLYHKESGGTGSSGWVVVAGLANEIPSISGNARKALRVNDAGSGIGWTSVPLDDPNAVAMSSIAASRYVYHSGSNQLIGKDISTIYTELEPYIATGITSNSTFIAAMKTALQHEHNYEDVEPGSTSTALSAPNDHSHTVSDIAVTKVTGAAIY